MISEMNISFAKLGEEQCETHSDRGLNVVKGIEYTVQKLINNVECKVDECNQCNEFDAHKLKANIARERYSRDKEGNNKNSVTMSIDMQKVIMLPRIPGVKTAVFTKRLILFHMTFAPLGGGTESPHGIIWNKSMAGRCDEDVTSTYMKLIADSKRDEKFFNFWVDNCSAQNKNWTLYTALCQVVNDVNTNCERITIRYLESDHTFMAADSFHAKIEGETKRVKNVYDFKDLLLMDKVRLWRCNLVIFANIIAN